MAVVKKTILGRILDMFFPNYCRGCGGAGSLLCEDCKSDMEIGIFDFGEKKIEKGELSELYVAGWREGALKKLVEDYKYRSTRGAAAVLAELLDEALPKDLGEMVIVPLPTVSKHIRERGFDHTLKLAKELGERREWNVSEILVRANKTVQVGADEEMRERQAEGAYRVSGEVSPERTYLLLDDVWTTGASMRAAARKMREAGARRILGAVVETGR